MENTTINYLPNELLVKIFSYFDDMSILRGRCVNKSWNCILSDKTYPMFDIWNPSSEISDENLQKIFLEACERGNVMWVEHISKVISKELSKLKFCPHELWNLGFVLSARHNNLDVLKLLSNYGISNGICSALEESVKNGNEQSTKFLLEEYEYYPYQLTRIFNL